MKPGTPIDPGLRASTITSIDLPRHAARAAALRFRAWPEIRWYASGKITLDPAYRYLARQARNSQRPLLDIGCGAGVLAAYLRACGHTARISGSDLDAKKIRTAQQALARENCDFRVGDVRDLCRNPQSSAPLPDTDIIMLDVLHYLNRRERHQLIESFSALLTTGSRVFLRTTLRDNSLRFAATRAEEWFVKACGWIPFSSVEFPEKQELLEAAAGAALTCVLTPMWGITPFNSYMVELQKP